MPSPKDTNGPIVKSGPTKGENRSRNNDGQWRKKRDDSGKSRDRKKSSGCFITTAVCHFRGLPDDCYELQKLRFFRDNHLMNSADGEALVARYYMEAPEIAKRLSRPDDLEYAWSEISQCVRLIEDGKHELAIRQYRAMFQTLRCRTVDAGD